MSSSPSAPPPQAKILQTRSLRTLFVVLTLGASVFGLMYYMSHRNDPGDVISGVVNSTGMVTAIEYSDRGQHVIAFGPDGKKIEQAETKPDSVDRDPVWRPDGNRIFFVSDRDGKSFQLYRWTPRAGMTPEVRSQGSLGKSGPTFDVGATTGDVPLLLVSGGFVLEFDPKDLKGHQVLPPPANSATQSQNQEDAGGSVSQFSQYYSQLGDSFRSARWCAGKAGVVAVMRGDRGEQLIIQETPKPGEKMNPPIPLALGDRVDFDVNPVDGSVVFVVQEVRASGKVDPKSRIYHFIGQWKPGMDHAVTLGASPIEAQAFSTPAISPQGDKVLLVAGNYDRKSSSLDPKVLITMPLQENGLASAAPLVKGEVFEPTWGPKGDLVAYAKRQNGSREIFVCKPDGSDEHSVSGKGDFGYPKFSPMLKTP